MTQTSSTTRALPLTVDEFGAFSAAAVGEPDWISSARKTGFQRFSELGLPTTRHEEWKYTSLRGLTRFTLVPQPPRSADAALNVDRWLLDGASASLVFVDGCYSAALSKRDADDSRVWVGTLAEAWSNRPDQTKALLESNDESHPFAAANTAFLSQGALIDVPKGVAHEAPIQLLFISSGREEYTSSHPRVLVEAGQSAAVTVVESWVGLGESPYFTNALTRVVVGENASVRHIKVTEESSTSKHIANIRVRQARDSRFESHNITLSGGLVRNDIEATLEGSGAQCRLNGLYLGADRQHIDNHTSIDHTVPHCQSFELYKGIMADRSTAVFNGKVYVREDAQKTDAKQSNKNLMLSARATVNTKPQLEIWADDVRCTHGATIGRLQDDALFYLRTRGLDRRTARAMLTYAFASDVLEQVPLESLRSVLDARLHGWFEAREAQS